MSLGSALLRVLAKGFEKVCFNFVFFLFFCFSTLFVLYCISLWYFSPRGAVGLKELPTGDAE